MIKKIIIVITVLTAIGFFSYPYIQHQWAIYQLQEKGIFLKTAMGGDAETVRKLEEQNFASAACSPNPEVLPLLLKTRFNVNSKREDGMTALHCAAADGKLQDVGFLLDHGANISARSNGTSNGLKLAPIHLAAAWHHIDVVELLKSRGANINEPSEVGSPLMIALTVLRRERFSPRDSFLHRETDLLAIYQAFQRMGGNLDVADEEGNTLLHMAMFSHQRPLLEAMLASGKFNLNLPNKAGDTPFMNFVRSAQYIRQNNSRTGVTADLDVIAQFIANGANVNARNKLGYAVMLDAAFKADLFELLVRSGADIFIADNIGKTVWSELQYQPPYIVIGFTDKLTTLTTPKMLDGKIANGPLHIFAQQSKPELVDYFLKRGLSPNERNDALNTPLHLTLQTPRYSPGQSTNDISIDQEQCIKKLLDAGADPNARNQHDETPLMLASRYPVLIVRMLLAKKADVNAIAKFRGTNKHVLDYFTEQRNLDGIRELIKAGASKSK